MKKVTAEGKAVRGCTRFPECDYTEDVPADAAPKRGRKKKPDDKDRMTKSE